MSIFLALFMAIFKRRYSAVQHGKIDDFSIRVDSSLQDSVDTVEITSTSLPLRYFFSVFPSLSYE